MCSLLLFQFFYVASIKHQSDYDRLFLSWIPTAVTYTSGPSDIQTFGHPDLRTSGPSDMWTVTAYTAEPRFRLYFLRDPLSQALFFGEVSRLVKPMVQSLSCIAQLFRGCNYAVTWTGLQECWSDKKKPNIFWENCVNSFWTLWSL